MLPPPIHTYYLYCLLKQRVSAELSLVLETTFSLSYLSLCDLVQQITTRPKKPAGALLALVALTDAHQRTHCIAVHGQRRAGRQAVGQHPPATTNNAWPPNKDRAAESPSALAMLCASHHGPNRKNIPVCCLQHPAHTCHADDCCGEEGIEQQLLAEPACHLFQSKQHATNRTAEGSSNTCTARHSTSRHIAAHRGTRPQQETDRSPNT